jgi:hypothetical protein
MDMATYGVVAPVGQDSPGPKASYFRSDGSERDQWSNDQRHDTHQLDQNVE